MWGIKIVIAIMPESRYAFQFSFFKERKTKINTILLASTGVILLFSTIIEKKFYKREYFGVFKEINQAAIDLEKKYGKENITIVLNTSAKQIFDFYFKQMNENVSFDYYAGDAPDFPAKMLNKIDSCPTSYFLYGWSNFLSPYEIPEMIKEKYPCIIYDEKHFNSQLTMFGKSDSCKRDTVFYSQVGFEKSSPLFLFDASKTDTSHFHSEKHSLLIESVNEYCITLKTSVATIFRENNVAAISAWIFSADSFNAQVVMEVGDPKGKHEWQTRLLKSFVSKKGVWQRAFAAFELPASSYPEDEVIIYLWNPGKNSFYLDDFTVSSFADSKYNYYDKGYRK